MLALRIQIGHCARLHNGHRKQGTRPDLEDVCHSGIEQRCVRALFMKTCPSRLLDTQPLSSIFRDGFSTML